MAGRIDEPLVREAQRLSAEAGFAHSCRPELGRLLRVLAAGVGPGKVGEAGTGYGVGTAWLAAGLQPGAQLYTVEHDPVRRALFGT